MAITLDGSNGILSPDFEPSSSTLPTNGLYLPSANTLGLATNGTERLRLDASGNLGIGTTNPTYKLTVAGYSNVASSNKLAIGGTADYQALFYMESANETFTIENTSDYAASAIILKTNNSERARIDSSGNLLVGTTSLPTGSTGGAGFEVAANARRILRLASTSTAANNLVEFYNPNGNVGNINTNGTATAFVTSSDERLKTNVIPADSAIQSILDFPVDQFDWIADGTHQDFGAVAQKAIKVIPEMISVPENPEEMWGIDWSKAVPRLIKTIQELTARLETLENK